MKQLAATLTALAFALGLTAAGYAQPPAKEGDKPAVQTQAPASASQAAPAQPEIGKKPAKAVTKKEKKAKAKAKKTEKKTTKKAKGKKPVAPAAEPKKE